MPATDDDDDASGVASDEPIVASVLMVDDHAANLFAMDAVLAPLGQRLVSARSGAEALSRLAEEEFAVVLLDVMMPGLDGFETATILRQSEPGRHVPVIFVTALDEAEAVAKGYARGAVDFLRKPYDPAALRAKVTVFVDLYVQRARVKRQTAMLRERERLFGILGHDLRAPLASIVFSAAVLAADASLSPRAASAARRVATSAQRMERMIEDLVDFARSRHGVLPVAPRACDLNAVCHEVIDEALAGNPGRAIEFASEVDGAGRWDPERLAQVVANLVSNALAYSPRDSAVRVHTADRGASIVLAVTNHGPPIPPDAVATLFDPFKRAATAIADRPSGLGLGLYIVRQIVDAHGGVVRVTSDAVAGTTFELELPRAASV